MASEWRRWMICWLCGWLNLRNHISGGDNHRIGDAVDDLLEIDVRWSTDDPWGAELRQLHARARPDGPPSATGFSKFPQNFLKILKKLSLEQSISRDFRLEISRIPRNFEPRTLFLKKVLNI